MNAAYGNIDAGVSIILAAPFITELNAPGWLSRLTHRCQSRGVEPTAIWVHSDLNTMHKYIEVRDAPRDGRKLTRWDEYAGTLNTDTPPPGVHVTIDNLWAVPVFGKNLADV